MCPLYPFHVIILWLCLILPLLFAVIEGAEELAGLKFKGLSLIFKPGKIDQLMQYNSTEVDLTLNCADSCDFLDDPGSNIQLILTNEKENIASLQIQVIKFLIRCILVVKKVSIMTFF